jgi:hypothetical protein
MECLLHENQFIPKTKFNLKRKNKVSNKTILNKAYIIYNKSWKQKRGNQKGRCI